MKSPRTIVLVLMVAAALAAPCLAQKNDSRSRGIQASYDDGKVDGMRVVVLRNDAGKFIPVDPSRQFKKDDQIKIAFEGNFDGYVYIVNVTPHGKKKVLFPHGEMSNNMITAHQRYELPTGGVMFFDEEKGLEVLQVIMAREPIALYDDAVKRSGGVLGDSAPSAAAELSMNAKTGVVIPPDKAVGVPGVRSRGLELAPASDNDEKGTTLIANPEKTGKSTRLEKGDVAMFEIRLRHV
ncbi:MAG TPA: DUF4384 domain-containing protein [Blastocatellia bacterium]|nr:DUF4384 domain-containing protein [Blastocatellia bacterium]